MSAKIVVINKCMDCPVDMCENRQVCGGIPPECELEDAQRILRFRCQVCGGDFEHTGIFFARYYCPYCGSYAVDIIKQTQKEK